MAKDDYHVIAYQVLSYLYQRLKKGLPAEPVMLSANGGLIKANERDWREKEVASSIHTQISSKLNDLVGFLSKMFPDSSTAQKVKTLGQSSQPWMNSGIVFHGEFWMQNSLEHPSAVEERTLSQVLEPSAPLKYFLSPEQIQSLIARATDRGTSLPPALMKAYQSQMSFLSNMRVLAEEQAQGHKEKVTEMMERLILSTPEAAQMLFVRRMLPSEYECLQGFPAGWTEIDSER